MASLLSPGDVCGGHAVVRLIGAGGFSEVYEATDATGARRALKIISARAGAGSKLRGRLAREAEALRRIQHSNVVRLFDTGLDHDTVYFVLELIEGNTLAEHLAFHRGLPPIDSVLGWLLQACEGVAEAHRVGVIHRDLKPANILITPSDMVKVIDFGIAKLRILGAPTTSGSLVGTALYMAPEQLDGRQADARVDVYAMGVILYEALAGVHPVDLDPESSMLVDVLQWHRVGELRSLAELAPEVSPALASLVERAMARDPDRRISSMAELADGLRAARADMVAASSVPLRHTPLLAGRAALAGAVSPLATTFCADEARAALLPQAPRLGSALPNPSLRPIAPELAPIQPPSRISLPRHGSSLPVASEPRRSRPTLGPARSAVLGLAVLLGVALVGLLSTTRGEQHAEMPAPTAAPSPAPLPTAEPAPPAWLGAGEHLVVEAGPTQMPDVIGYCGDRDSASVCAFDGATLRLRWRASAGVDGRYLDPLGAAGSWVAYSDQGGLAHVVDLATGTARGDVSLGGRAKRVCVAPPGASSFWFALEDGGGMQVDPVALRTTAGPLPGACKAPDLGIHEVVTPNGLRRVVFPSDVTPELPGWVDRATRTDGAIGVQLVVAAPSGTVPTLVGFAVRKNERGIMRWKRPVPPGDGLSGRAAGWVLGLAGGHAVTIYEDLTGTLHMVAIEATSGTTLWDVQTAPLDALMVSKSRVYVQRGTALNVLDAAKGRLAGNIGQL